jgi:hypothetical protein
MWTRGRTQTLNPMRESLSNKDEVVWHTQRDLCSLYSPGDYLTVTCTRNAQIYLSTRTPTILTIVFPRYNLIT